jgi:hypothetical protein
VRQSSRRVSTWTECSLAQVGLYPYASTEGRDLAKEYRPVAEQSASSSPPKSRITNCWLRRRRSVRQSSRRVSTWTECSLAQVH